MERPSPTFSFTLPSLHDGCKLECRLYLPSALHDQQSASTWPIRGAIIAHPYAPLGGCYDDPVVNFVAAELLHAGYVVGTFNFRGAGGSEGRTSWTAKPELGDYVSFYGFMLQYLHFLQFAIAPTTQDEDPNTPESTTDRSRGIQLVLGGYSYGSLIASHVPTLDATVDLFQSVLSASADSPLRQIGRLARRIAVASTEKLRGADAPGLADDARLCTSTTHVSYLLVSPLLPPISQFLTVFSALSLTVRVESSSAGGKHIPCPRPFDQLSRHRTLALFGDQDNFTAARKLEKWSDELARVPQSQFQAREIGGAGHFWRETRVEAQARQALREWIHQP